MYSSNAFSRIGCWGAVTELCCGAAGKIRRRLCGRVGNVGTTRQGVGCENHHAVVKLGPDFGAVCVSVLPGLMNTGVSSLALALLEEKNR